MSPGQHLHCQRRERRSYLFVVGVCMTVAFLSGSLLGGLALIAVIVWRLGSL